MTRKARSNIGRLSRNANKQRKRRLERTAQQHFEDNERSRIRNAERRAKELILCQMIYNLEIIITEQPASNLKS